MRTDSPAVTKPTTHCSAAAALGPMLLAMLLALPSCVGDIEGIANSDGEPLDSVDAGPPPPHEDADAQIPIPQPESVCDDNLDNDDDTLTDCADPDCAGASNCGYPTGMVIDIDLFYDASSIAEWAGQNDCTTDLTIAVAADADTGCGTCHKSYTGPYVYGLDTCPEAERPLEGSYSFVFTSESQREVYVLDAEGLWALVGTATGSNGVFTVTRTDPVIYDGYDAGTMNTVITITDQ